MVWPRHYVPVYADCVDIYACFHFWGLHFVRNIYYLFLGGILNFLNFFIMTVYNFSNISGFLVHILMFGIHLVMTKGTPPSHWLMLYSMDDFNLFKHFYTKFHVFKTSHCTILSQFFFCEISKNGVSDQNGMHIWNPHGEVIVSYLHSKPLSVRVPIFPF